MSNSKIDNSINQFLSEQQLCFNNIIQDTSKLKKIVDMLLNARDKGRIIFTMGNGGSGSTATHLVSDLLKTSITKNNKRIKAISLTDNIPVMLAWSNDVSYDDVFVEQLKNFASKNDIVVCFSGSGNSKNVIKALQFAKKNKLFCIGFTGKSGGKMSNLCDVCFKVPSTDMLAIESVHLTLCHCIMNAIRNTGKPQFTYG